MNTSLQRRLSRALSVAIVAVALTAGMFSFFSAFHDANELQDDMLLQVAELVRARGVLLPPMRTPQRMEDADHDSTLIVRPLDLAEPSSATESKAAVPDFPRTLADGLHTARAHRTYYRVLVATLSTGEKFAVAQETSVRNEAAARGALRTLLPLAILVPLLLFIVSHLVRDLFRPVTDAAGRVDARAVDDLHPVSEAGMPAEVQPFIRSINRLLARVAESIARQRRFIADAAHELRSPLAALSLQAERLEQAGMTPAARDRLATLRGGIARNRVLINQLLALSRAQDAADPERSQEPTPLRAVFRQVLEELMPLAHARRIDLGVIDAADATLHASALELNTLVKNLVDNAIRYTPEGGRVDLSLAAQAGGVVLRVADTGPGIAPDERTRVFDPFYRILGSEQTGSGLGLAIVQTIAERLGARIELTDTDTEKHTGLTVVVVFPPARDARPGASGAPEGAA